MITHNIKWFLGVSVAAHAAVLVAWQAPAYAPGNTGRMLQLSVMQQGDEITASLSAPAENPDRSRADNMTPPMQPKTPPRRVVTESIAAREKTTIPVHTASPEQRLATQPPTIESTQTSTASRPVIIHEDADRHLRNSVMELITRELTYPAIARRKGWQGVVKLELRIEADGSITGLQVDKTSGYAILDKAAMQCLQLASIPDAAQWLRGQAINIVVPVEYRLLGG